MSVLSPGRKKSLLVALVCCFVVQTTFVYTDDSPTVVLSDTAVAGAKIWHQGNCQACHQVYGFGGFLGPDLTNVASRLGEDLRGRLAFVVIEGPGQMPAYELDGADLDALTTFLVELDRTGVGQARVANDVTDAAGSGAFYTTVDALLVGEQSSELREGFELYTARPCAACHPAFLEGPSGAPDITTLGQRLSSTELDHVLKHGRPPRMPVPTPALSAEERQTLGSFLRWLSDRRDALKTGAEARMNDTTIDWSDVPWWEFR